MDPISPFASRKQVYAPVAQRAVHVNFCRVCHYVWKAPAVATQCVNCKNADTAVSLAHYETEAQVM